MEQVIDVVETKEEVVELTLEQLELVGGGGMQLIACNRSPTDSPTGALRGPFVFSPPITLLASNHCLRSKRAKKCRRSLGGKVDESQCSMTAQLGGVADESDPLRLRPTSRPAERARRLRRRSH